MENTITWAVLGLDFKGCEKNQIAKSKREIAKKGFKNMHIGLMNHYANIDAAKKEVDSLYLPKHSCLTVLYISDAQFGTITKRFQS